jgi:hypothetical protein
MLGHKWLFLSHDVAIIANYFLAFRSGQQPVYAARKSIILTA